MHSRSASATPHGASVGTGHGLQGHASDPSSATVSCDSGFHRRAYTVVDDYNTGASAPTEAGGSSTPAEAGGSRDSGEVVGRLLRQREVVWPLRVTRMTYGRSEIHLIGILRRGSVRV
ncbi:uncharacterized protein DS421_15g513550 [Arachis hypogaea]|nr:uncharacterized protein DS421_15g513550 [Arachis hypogaea]